MAGLLLVKFVNSEAIKIWSHVQQSGFLSIEAVFFLSSAAQKVSAKSHHPSLKGYRKSTDRWCSIHNIFQLPAQQKNHSPTFSHYGRRGDGLLNYSSTFSFSHSETFARAFSSNKESGRESVKTFRVEKISKRTDCFLDNGCLSSLKSGLALRL